ncbi:MAG: hypothetical protein KGL39_12260 [Patescibacteria group bacterium]|nr:hypothetical protein [Patescibacteria group bacterium]
MVLPPNSRCADGYRTASRLNTEELSYGLLEDGHWPITPRWWEKLEQAADDRYIAVANGELSFPRCRTACCIGGGLVRAMGSICPAPMKHNFIDNVWDDVAREHNLLRPVADVYVEHHHHIRGTAAMDATFERGSKDFAEDQARYEEWLVSDDKKRMDDRIANYVSKPPGIV